MFFTIARSDGIRNRLRKKGMECSMPFFDQHCICFSISVFSRAMMRFSSRLM